MGEKKVVDLFMMFEAAGDSEAGFGAEMVDDQGNVALADKCDEDHVDDDDDAESCSSDVGCYGSSSLRDPQIEIRDHHAHYDDDADKHDDDDGKDLDDGVRDWKGNKIRDGIDHHHHYDHHDHDRRALEGEEEEGVVSEVTSTANSYSARKCVRSSKRKMSEVEKSKLFWEACLAS